MSPFTCNRNHLDFDPTETKQEAFLSNDFILEQVTSHIFNLKEGLTQWKTVRVNYKRCMDRCLKASIICVVVTLKHKSDMMNDLVQNIVFLYQS